MRRMEQPAAGCLCPLLYSGGDDGNVHVWDIDTGSLWQSLQPHKEGPRA